MGIFKRFVYRVTGREADLEVNIPHELENKPTVEYNPYNHKNFEYKLCVSYNTGLHRYHYDTDFAQLPYMMNTWLATNVGKENYIFGFEDYGQHGEWMLYTLKEEDMLAFKLRWCNR